MKISRYLLAALFVGSGTLHLVRPKPFYEIVPPQLPRRELLVAISGVAEIFGGVGMLIPATRRTAGWGLMALLTAVFPANIYMAEANIQPEGIHIPAAFMWARLPLQPLLIWWILAATKKEKGRDSASRPPESTAGA
jgi:uncharacterized membrane protein